LANGMEILLLADPLQLRSAPSHVSLSVAGGFLHDPAHLPGLATLAGHLVFNNYVPVSSPPSYGLFSSSASSRAHAASEHFPTTHARSRDTKEAEAEQADAEHEGDTETLPPDTREEDGMREAGRAEEGPERRRRDERRGGECCEEDELQGFYPSLDAFLFANNAAEPLHFSTGEFASSLSYSVPAPALSASLRQLRHVLLHPNITEASVGVGVIQLLQQQQKQVRKRRSEPYWRKASILKNHVFNPAHTTSRFHVGSTDLLFLLLHHQQQTATLRRPRPEGAGGARDASSSASSSPGSAPAGPAAKDDASEDEVATAREEGEGVHEGGEDGFSGAWRGSEGRERGGGASSRQPPAQFERVALPMVQHLSVWLRNEHIPSLVWDWHDQFYVANAFKLVISTPGSVEDLDRLTRRIQRLFGSFRSNPELAQAFTCDAHADTPFFSSAKEAERVAREEAEALRAVMQARRDDGDLRRARDAQDRPMRQEGDYRRAGAGAEDWGSRRTEGRKGRNSAGAPFFQPTRVPQVACLATPSATLGEGASETCADQTGSAAGSREASTGNSATHADSGAAAEKEKTPRKGNAPDSGVPPEEDSRRKRDDPRAVPVARHCDLKKEVLMEPATDHEHSVDFVFVFEKPHPEWNVFDAKYVVDVLGSEGPGSLISQLRQQGLADAIDVEAEESRCYSTLRVSVEIKDYNVNHTALTLIGSALFSYLRFIRESPLDRAFVESRVRMYRLAFDAHVPPLPPRPPLPSALGTARPLLASHASNPASSPGQAGARFSPQEEAAYLAADLQEVSSPDRVFTEQWLFENVKKPSLERYIDQLKPDNLILMISSPLVVPLCTLVSSFFGIPFAVNPLDATQELTWSALASLPADRALLLGRRTGFSLPLVSFFLPPDARLTAGHHLNADEEDAARRAGPPSARAETGEAVLSSSASAEAEEEEARALFFARPVPRLLSFDADDAEEAGQPLGAERCRGRCELFHLPYRVEKQDPPRASVTLLLNYAQPNPKPFDDPRELAETREDARQGGAPASSDARHDRLLSAAEFREKALGLMGLYVATVKEMLHEVTVYASMAEISFSVEADPSAPRVEVHVEGVSAVLPALTELIVKGLVEGSPGPPVELSDAASPAEPADASPSWSVPSEGLPPLPSSFACRDERRDACAQFLDIAAFSRVKHEKLEEIRQGSSDLPTCLSDVVSDALLRSRVPLSRRRQFELVKHAGISEVEDAGAMLKGKVFLQALVTGDISAAAAKGLVARVATRLQLSRAPAIEELTSEPVISMQHMAFPAFLQRQLRVRGSRALPALPRYRWRLVYDSAPESNLCTALLPAASTAGRTLRGEERDRKTPLNARQHDSREEPLRRREETKQTKRGGKNKSGDDGPRHGAADPRGEDGLSGLFLRISTLRIELGKLTDAQLAMATILEVLLAYPMYRHVCALEGACHSLSFSLHQEAAGVSYFRLELRAYDMPACIAVERAEAWLFTQAGIYSRGVSATLEPSAFSSSRGAPPASLWRASGLEPESASAGEGATYPADGETVLLRRDFFKTYYSHSQAAGAVAGEQGYPPASSRTEREEAAAGRRDERSERTQRQGSGTRRNVPAPPAFPPTAATGIAFSAGPLGALATSVPGGAEGRWRAAEASGETRNSSPAGSSHGARAPPAGAGLSPQAERAEDLFRSDASFLAAAFDPRQHRGFGEPGFFALMDPERFQKAKDTAESALLMLYPWEAEHVQRRRRRARKSASVGSAGRDPTREAPQEEDREYSHTEDKPRGGGERGPKGDVFRGRPFIPADVQMFVHEIRRRSYLFARREQVARHIQGLTLEDAQDFLLNFVILAPWLLIELSDSPTLLDDEGFKREPGATDGIGGMLTAGSETCAHTEDYYLDRSMPDMTTLETGGSSNPLWRLRNSWVDVESVKDFRKAATKSYSLGSPLLYRSGLHLTMDFIGMQELDPSD
ncbi:hypothetical protein BESB_075390, partial [Besnoitia besnoiti]